MSKDKSRYRRKLLFNLAGVLLLSLVITLAFFHDTGDGPRAFLLGYAWSLLICFTQWFGNSYVYILLDRRYSWEEHLVKRAILGSLSIILYSSIAFMLVQMLMYKLTRGSLPDDALYWGLRSSWLAIVVAFVISMFFVAVAFFKKWKQSLLETERIRTEMLQYKYESLQNQINPHFLFNSFNVLSELVYEDQGKAVDFIRQLGQLFRYVLDSRDRELVPLEEEVSFLEAYCYLLQTRFEEKLIIDLDLKAAPLEMIVPMTLQLLLENCVKHNEISASQPLHIRISRGEDHIRVENTLQPRQTGPESTGTGLSNLQQQYQYFTDEALMIEEGEETFSVEVPILKAEKA